MAQDVIVGDVVSRQDCAKNKAECYQLNILPIMEEIKNLGRQINDFKLEIVTKIAEMPEKILEKADNKYAGKSVEEDVKDIQKRMEGRVFEWLKILVTAIITLGFSYLLFRSTH